MPSSRSLRRQHRHRRVRARIHGTSQRPRLSIFRSSQHIRVQLIDDQAGQTLASASDLEMKQAKGTKTEIATAVGKLLAEKAIAKKISTVIFDRGGHQYHGRVKALADAARENGLKF